MKKNIILYILIILLIIFIGFITYAKVRNTNDKKPVVNDNPTNEQINEPVKKLDLTSETLFEYGKKIYDDKTYTKYKKNEFGVYVITYGDLINEGYTLSFLGENCLDESEIIKIDADYVLKSSYYEGYPVMFTKACLTPEAKKQMELDKQNIVDQKTIE